MMSTYLRRKFNEELYAIEQRFQKEILDCDIGDGVELNKNEMGYKKFWLNFAETKTLYTGSIDPTEHWYEMWNIVRERMQARRNLALENSTR